MAAYLPIWQRLIDDVKRTTGKTLVIERAEDCIHLPNRAEWGDRSVVYIQENVDAGIGAISGIYECYGESVMPLENWFAEAVDRLQEQVLHEEIWGGWPICGVHGSHPLVPFGATENGEVAWICSNGDFEPVRVGDLDRSHIWQ